MKEGIEMGITELIAVERELKEIENNIKLTMTVPQIFMVILNRLREITNLIEKESDAEFASLHREGYQMTDEQREIMENHH